MKELEMKLNNLTHIFLFGHRKQHGKDTSVALFSDILCEKNIRHKSAFFAETLKLQSADRYGLDVSRMNDDEYKNSKPPHLGGLSVRDVLIKEGCFARSIWQNTWAFPMYRKLYHDHREINDIKDDIKVGLCSDFRFPNEALCYEECFNLITSGENIDKAKVIKVLVHRPSGKFVNDGADDQLPDVDPYWDYIIYNDDNSATWKNNIKNQLQDMIKCYLG